METTKALLSPRLVGFSEIRVTPIKGWEQFLAEGRQFLQTANNAYHQQRKAFSAEVLYNLVAMAIEKLIMAQLMAHGNLPYNHTMHDLVEAMEEFLPGRLQHLRAELQALDAWQDICGLDEYTIKVPDRSEILHMLEVANELERLTINRIFH